MEIKRDLQGTQAADIRVFIVAIPTMTGVLLA